MVKNIVCFLGVAIFFFACKKERSGNDSPILELGQHFGGGVIFYIDGSGEHGLVAAEQDVDFKVKWADTCCKTNASFVEVGRGMHNTNSIFESFGVGNYAASVCRQLDVNGYKDWFLPSKNELNLLYQKRNLVGGFSTDYYWSSSEKDSLHAWYLYFPYGPQYFVNKDSVARVRAVRAF